MSAQFGDENNGIFTSLNQLPILDEIREIFYKNTGMTISFHRIKLKDIIVEFFLEFTHESLFEPLSDYVQTLKPTIRRGFIANTTSYPFLDIQPGLITR